MLILWALLLVFLFLSFRSFSLYQINDDFFLFGIVSGVLYGFSSTEAVFISSPINYILKFLFENFSDYNWYFEMIFLSLFISIFVYSFHIFKLFKIELNQQFMWFLALNLIPIFIFFQMFYLIQFSQIAIISAGVATLVLLQSQSRFMILLSVILLFLGMSWRNEAAILAIALVLIVHTYFLLIEKKLVMLFSLRNYLIFVFVAAVFVIKAINFLGISPWQSDEKNSYQKIRYDIIRTYDFAPTNETRKLQKEVALDLGWSKNDFSLYERNYYADSNIYSDVALDELAKQSAPQYSLSFLYKSFAEFIILLKNNHLLSIVGIILYTLVVFAISNRSLLIVGVPITSIFFLFLFMVYLLGKMPDRIFWPLGFVYLLAIAGHFVSFNQIKIGNVKNLLVSALAAIGLAGYLAINTFQTASDTQWWKTVREDGAQGFDRVLEFESDKPIVAFSTFYSPLIQTLDPKSSQVDQIFRDMVYINWATRSPDSKHHLASLSLAPDLFSSVATGDAYLATSRIEELQMVNQYLIEHHQIEPVWDVAPFVFSDTGLGIWKILEVKPIAK